VKNSDLQLYQNFPLLFFTGRKLRPPGIGIEATELVWLLTETASES